MLGRLFGVIGGCAGLAFAAVLVKGYAEKRMSAAGFTYETSTISVGEVRKVIATSGTVKPRTTVQVGSELSGRVKSIVADFNDRVSAGAILATIDPKTFESKAQQARADLQAAQAAVTSSEAALRKAISNLTNAEAVHDRQKLLGQKGIAAQVNIDGSVRDLNVARAEIDVTNGNLENARAVVAQKTAQLEQAMIDLERTNIRTPISGIVLQRSIDVGQTVAASLQAPELYRIAGDMSVVNIEAQVSEVDVGAVKKGQFATFAIDAYPGRKFSGRVEQVRVAPAAADTVVTYAVIISAENSSNELFSGMTAHVQIETAARREVPRVALDAIRFKPPAQAAPPAESGGALRRLLTGEPVQEPKSADSDEKGSARRDSQTIIKRWARRLQLDEQQVSQLTALMHGETASATNPRRLASNEDPSSIDVKPRSSKSHIEEVIATVLRPEQLEEFDQYRRNRQDARRASVWILSPAGNPEERTVRIGLADQKFVELIGNELKVGDAVVVRSRKVKAQ